MVSSLIDDEARARLSDASKEKAVRDEFGSSKAETNQSESGKSGDEEVNKEAPVRSYSAVVGKGKHHQISKRDVLIEVKDGIEFSVIPEDVLDDIQPIWSELLIGRFVDKAPNLAIIHKIVNQIWTYGVKDAKIDVFVVGVNTVKFRIRHEESRRKVLKKRLWHIAGVPMRLERCAPQSDLDDEVVSFVPLWVTLKGVPRALYNWKGLSYIASRVGSPSKLHMDTQLCAKFDEAKVLVDVDITKEFPSSHRFRSRKGLDVTITFEYPWLPMKCSVCNHWGHKESFCSEKVEDNNSFKELEVIDTNDEVVKSPAENSLQIEEVQDTGSLAVVPVTGGEGEKECERMALANNNVSNNPLFEQVLDDLEEGWSKPSSPLKRTNVEVSGSVQVGFGSPSRFDCLDERVEDGEIKDDAIVDVAQQPKEVVLGELKKQAVADASRSSSRHTRSSSQPQRGARSGSANGRGRGRKPF